jgi:hypothetical protein
MPQITCPNCGTTISLENRREVDFKLIRDATDRHPRTFTELLHVTRLSRKTLNLRLKELCSEGILLKEEGMYKSNGASEFGNNGGHIVKGFSKMFEDKRVRTGLMLVALLASFSVSGYVLAMMVAPTTYVQPHVELGPLGTLTVAVSVNNVSDLYAWQAAIAFNSTQMRVTETTPGDFMSVEFPYFDSSTDTSDGLLLLFGTLKGNATGITGSGTLATIVFEYYFGGYTPPSIVSQKAGFDTWLAQAGEDFSLVMIPGGQSLLALAPVS